MSPSEGEGPTGPTGPTALGSPRYGLVYNYITPANYIHTHTHVYIYIYIHIQAALASTWLVLCLWVFFLFFAGGLANLSPPAGCARSLHLFLIHASDLRPLLLISLGRQTFIHSFIFFASYPRKFRSQTSDNMDRWKAEQGRGREKRKIRRKKSRRERVRRKKMQMREKVGKSRNTVFFEWFMAPEGRKVGSLKRRVRSQLARGEMKNCTPLRREAHLQVKMYKTPGSWSTFGSWDVENVYAVVARSTFASKNAQNTSVSDQVWKLRCRKNARRCGAKHISKSKCTKHTIVRPLLECTLLWREAHFQVKMYKAHHVRTTFGSSNVEKVHAVVARSIFRSEHVQSTTCSRHFWRFRCRFAWQAQRLVHLVKREQNVRVLQHFQKRWQAWGICACRVAGAIQKTCSSEMFGGQLISWERLHFGVSDLQVCWDDFAWQVQHFVWPDINFSWQAQSFTQVEWKNPKTHWYEVVSSAINFPILKEVSQNSFVFDVFNFEKRGSLAELLRFWTLLGWKIKEVSQNCFVFDVVKFEKWEGLAEELRFQSGR